MAYTSGFFDAVDQGGGNYDRVYSAANFAHYFSLLVQNGVFPDPSTGMQVKASTNPDMHVSVQPGSGWVNGYYITVMDDTPEQLTIPTANPSLSRIDSVIMGLNYVQREIQLYIKSGAVSASPSAVSLQRDNDLYEMELAQITVAAGVASISQANITDMRQNTSRCGIVKGTIEQIDTTDLFAQYNDAFQTWFADIKAQLSGDVATNLQNQINTLKTDKVNVLDKASTAQAQAGTDDTKWMTPALVKSFTDKNLLPAIQRNQNQINNLSIKVNENFEKTLSTETKALYGLGADTVPDDAFVTIKTMFDSRVRLASGTYTGTGTCGEDSKNLLTFPFPPKVVLIFRVAGMGLMTGSRSSDSESDASYSMIAAYPASSTGVIGSSSGRSGFTTNILVFSGNSMSWYSSGTRMSDQSQLNESGVEYRYYVIGGDD